MKAEQRPLSKYKSVREVPVKEDSWAEARGSFWKALWKAMGPVGAEEQQRQWMEEPTAEEGATAGEHVKNKTTPLCWAGAQDGEGRAINEVVSVVQGERKSTSGF